MIDLRDKKVLVVGLGKTGQSVLPVLERLGARIQATDSRASPPDIDALKSQHPGIEWRLGGFDPELFADQDLIIASPGLAQSDPAFVRAREAGVRIIGDIELFYQLAQAPIVAITGSNGKSTVTTLVAEMAAAAGLKMKVGGNLGTPALELLPQGGEQVGLYVLELSSFQLELIENFRPRVAAVLNLSEDHMDRYAGFEDYVAAKARIFANMQPGDTLVLNGTDAATSALATQAPRGVQIVLFGRKVPAGTGNVRVLDQGFGEYLTLDGAQDSSYAVLPVNALQILGEHNLENAMAAVAIAFAAGVPLPAAASALKAFRGLPHRMVKVAEINGVSYFDDSKGTNVGATAKALAGLPGPVIPILGGDCKGADLGPLRDALRDKARAAILIGRDAPLIEAVVQGVVPIHQVSSMPEAVMLAAELARSGDQVLLSPACASLDMFRDYAERGRVFSEAVQHLRGARA